MKKPFATTLCAAFALIIGVAALLGSALQNPLWFPAERAPLVIGAALGLTLAGIALLLPAAWRHGRRVSGVLLLLCGAFMLAPLLFGVDAALDWPAPENALRGSRSDPGRMPSQVGVGFLLIGIALLLEASAPSRRRALLRETLALAVVTTGLAGVIVQVLKLQYVYGWHDTLRIPLHAGVALGLLGIGLWIEARRPSAAQQQPGGRDILATVAASLALVTVVSGVMGFAFLQNRVERMTSESLVRLHSDRSRLFTKIILQHTLDAAAIAAHPGTVAQMRRLETAAADTTARTRLEEIARGYLSSGFAWVGFHQKDRLAAEAGTRTAQPELAITLQGPYRRELLWHHGFHLRVRAPVRDQKRIVGEVVTEQPLDVLTTLAADANQWGDTGEMLLCALAGDPFRCFPARFSDVPFTVARTVNGEASIMTQALGNQAGVVSAIDLRGQRVLAAYGAVGNYGLGLVFKMDWAELYAPLRRQLQIMLLSLAALIGLSLWLVHGRVRPLVGQLVESRRSAQANEARFLAAAETNLDGFYILESQRDANGDVVDFRFAFLNANGAKLISTLPKEGLLGQPLCQTFPWVRREGFFDKFTRVAETGEPLMEEVALAVPSVKATWLSLQIVRLGDGIAITARDVSERRSADERFKYLAQNDMLTGLPNRALFFDRFQQAMARARRHGQPMALLFLDIDRFKHINDTFGHAAGDELLRAFAERVRNCVRESDTVARLAGDEFTVIVEGLHGDSDAETVAKKILAALTPPIRLADQDVTISSSIGIALYSKDDGAEMTADLLLERADAALYHAKRTGRNRHALYAPSMSAADSGPAHG